MPIEHNQQEARRALIRTPLRERQVRTQAELARQLQALGHLVTQSSVSRDLREMQVIKDPEGYHLPDQAPVTPSPDAYAFIRNIAAAGANLLVIKTATGAAQRVAFELDRSGWPDIIGTISGDDTIFIATGGQAAHRRLTARLEQAAAEHHND